MATKFYLHGYKIKRFSTRDLKTARGHMMPPLLPAYNGLARPADESMFAQNNETDIGATGHSET